MVVSLSSDSVLLYDSDSEASCSDCRENEEMAATPIRMSVSRLTTVNINQVLASSPITGMAFLQDPPCYLLHTMKPT